MNDWIITIQIAIDSIESVNEGLSQDGKPKIFKYVFSIFDVAHSDNSYSGISIIIRGAKRPDDNP